MDVGEVVGKGRGRQIDVAASMRCVIVMNLKWKVEGTRQENTNGARYEVPST